MQRIFLLIVLLGSSALLSCRHVAAQGTAATTPVDTTGGEVNVIPKFSDQNTMVNSSIVDDDGSVSMGKIETGQTGFSPDNIGPVRSFVGQAGPQLHFQLSRAYCDKRSNSTQSTSDQANFFCVPDAVTINDTHPPSSTPNKNFLIEPYKFGMAMEYPGVLEVFAEEFSVHTNKQRCPVKGTCNYGAVLWVGDVDDFGGVMATAFDGVATDSFTIDRSKSFVSIRSETFGGASHGDMLFVLRDPLDNFRFQFGPRDSADGAGGIYKQFTKARIDSTGKGFFDGGTQTGGADFAESVSAVGNKTEYESGDVLVIDTYSDRQVSLSSAAYSTLVAGIYSTKPGVVATMHTSEDPALKNEIPMAVVGIVPCKVSAENGPISRGDLLVTSSSPGYAMRATDQAKLPGAIIGKALQPLSNGKGKIEVLVTLR
jgi:hypothetical protein